MSIGYYQKNEERLWKKAHERYQNLSEEDKNEQKYDRELYKIFSVGEKD